MTIRQGIALHCTHCGSDDILIDAWAVWDVETQQAVLHSTYDNWYCESCEGECNVSEEPVVLDTP